MIILLSAVLGIMEGIILGNGGYTGKRIFLKQFSFYHFLLEITFLGLASLTSEYFLIPYMILAQDICSKLMPEMEWFKPGDWATWPTYKLYLWLPLYMWAIIFYTAYLFREVVIK